jgi:hypothetical protein
VHGPACVLKSVGLATCILWANPTLFSPEAADGRTGQQRDHDEGGGHVAAEVRHPLGGLRSQRPPPCAQPTRCRQQSVNRASQCACRAHPVVHVEPEAAGPAAAGGEGESGGGEGGIRGRVDPADSEEHDPPPGVRSRRRFRKRGTELQGGSVRKGELETQFISKTLWLLVSSSPFLAEPPCTEDAFVDVV